jgi:hypothetical protein
MGSNPRFHTADTRDHNVPHANFLQRFEEDGWNRGGTVRLACIYELGYAFVYMNYLNDDIDWEPQRSRVVALSKELRLDKDLADWRYFYARIIDEIENMC